MTALSKDYRSGWKEALNIFHVLLEMAPPREGETVEQYHARVLKDCAALSNQAPVNPR